MKRYKSVFTEARGIPWQEIYSSMASKYYYGSGVAQEMFQGFDMYAKKYKLKPAEDYDNEQFNYLWDLVKAHSANYKLSNSEIDILNSF